MKYFSMNDIRFILEIIVISGGGGLLTVLFTKEPMPINRLLRIFLGSFILSALIGYMISESNFQRFWYIGCILLSAFLGETVIEVIKKETPTIVKSLLQKYFNTKPKDE